MNRFGTVNGVAAAKNETVTARKEICGLGALRGFRTAWQLL